MISVICGKPGKGKTAFGTYLLAKLIIENGSEDWHNCNRELRELRKGGFNFLEPPPQRHCCFSDYPVRLGRRYQSYYVDGFQIGFSNPYFKTVFLPPYSKVILDEAQRYYDSRMSKYLRPEVYNFYQLHRQNHYDFYLICQRLSNIDLNIRGIADRFYVIDDLEVTKSNWGIVTKLTWTIREFEAPETAESYTLAKERNENKDLGIKRVISTDLCVFDYYDSFANKPMFYSQHYNESFDYYTESGYEFTLDSFVEFNNRHYYVAPKGFWKNNELDKEIKKKGVV